MLHTGVLVTLGLDPHEVIPENGFPAFSLDQGHFVLMHLIVEVADVGLESHDMVFQVADDHLHVLVLPLHEEISLVLLLQFPSSFLSQLGDRLYLLFFIG